ncbi:CbiX/SirB N-terminal domain-containing protein [Actinoplanes sp. NPDC051851]|uniref:sirohydrochlorin chelatase n=1 Tax=Actinoplanes sp. NPDC051851 TaxID=3154753 RepID=UPI0034185466
MRTARLTVVMVAHGSRDPRAAVATESLARALRRSRPGWGVRASYLDHDGPRPLEVLAGLPAGSRAVLVPLLLTEAYHGRVDLPAVLRDAAGLPVRVTMSRVLGPSSPLLLDALCAKLSTASPAAHPPLAPLPLAPLPLAPLPLAPPPLTAPPLALPPASLPVSGSLSGSAACLLHPDSSACAVPGSGSEGAPGVLPRRRAGLDAVVLASAGTRDAAARETVAEAAERLGERLGVPSAVSYASGAGPRADEAVAGLRERGARRVGMAAYFLAPGLLYDKAASAARAAGAVAVADPLAASPDLVRLVAGRVEAALGREFPASPLAEVA